MFAYPFRRARYILRVHEQAFRGGTSKFLTRICLLAEKKQNNNYKKICKEVKKNIPKEAKQLL